MSSTALYKNQVYLSACLVLALAPYVKTLLFPYFGNYFHGGKPIEAIVNDIILVVGCYAALEILRASKSHAKKIISTLLLTPLVIILLFEIFFAFKIGLQHVVT